MIPRHRDHPRHAVKQVAVHVGTDHRSVLIPYGCMDIEQSYEPDFLVGLANGVPVALEIKGLADYRSQQKSCGDSDYCKLPHGRLSFVRELLLGNKKGVRWRGRRGSNPHGAVPRDGMAC